MNKVAKLQSRNVRPVHKHDCACCRFLGRLNGEDLYYCIRHGEYIRRFGSREPDYGSLGDFTPPGSPYALAAKLWEKVRENPNLIPNAYTA